MCDNSFGELMAWGRCWGSGGQSNCRFANCSSFCCLSYSKLLTQQSITFRCIELLVNVVASNAKNMSNEFWILNPYNRVLHGLIYSSGQENLQSFMEPEGSLPYLHYLEIETHSGPGTFSWLQLLFCSLLRTPDLPAIQVLLTYYVCEFPFSTMRAT